MFVFPPQLLHEFTCHTDSTENHLCGSDEIAIGPQHQHCDILDLFFSPYQAEKKDFDFNSFRLPFKREAIDVHFTQSGSLLCHKNRGPPFIF